MKAVTGKPIKFVSVGEKIDSLQPFHPDRMASRILGMGDIMTLVEKAEKEMDQKRAAELQAKIEKAEVSLEDFLDQMKQIKKMGPINDILKMIPGIGDSKDLKYLKVSDKDLVRMGAIIESMTPQERRDPRIINGSRRLRIARGSGTTTHEVNQLLKQFAQASKIMKAYAKGSRFKLGKHF
jgi:signal recognition particle subunit SRP54